MLARLFLLFVVVPVAELILLVQLGQALGFWPTLGIVLGTGFLGATLARGQGTRVMLEVQRELAAGRMPGRQLQDAVAILVGGALLLAPGLITDLAGLALLFPPTRRWLQARLRRSLERGLTSGALRVSVLRWEPFGGGGGPAPSAEDAPPGLDPRNEIRIPPPPDRGR